MSFMGDMRKLELIATQGIYVLQLGDVVKVGRSDNLVRRIKNSRTFLPPGRASLYGIIPNTSGSLIEQEAQIHAALHTAEQHLGREWFYLSDQTVRILDDAGLITLGWNIN